MRTNIEIDDKLMKRATLTCDRRTDQARGRGSFR